MRPVRRRMRLGGEVRELAVADNANDLGGDVRAGHRDHEPLAERAALREVLARQRLADDDHVRFLLHFALGEESAALERHVHRAEIAVVTDADVHDVVAARRRWRLAFDCEPGPRAETAERQVADGAGGLNARNLLDSRDRLAKEADPLLVVAIRRVRQLQSHRQDVARAVAGIDTPQRSEAAQHQSRADEQDDGQRDLRDHEGLPESAMADARASLPRAVLQRLLDLRARSLECRRESAYDRRQKGRGGREQEYRITEADRP